MGGECPPALARISLLHMDCTHMLINSFSHSPSEGEAHTRPYDDMTTCVQDHASAVSACVEELWDESRCGWCTELKQWALVYLLMFVASRKLVASRECGCLTFRAKRETSLKGLEDEPRPRPVRQHLGLKKPSALKPFLELVQSNKI